MLSKGRLFLISAASVVLSGCNNSGNQSALNPAGEQAGHLNNLWWIFFGICAFVYVAVMIFLLVALVKNRQKQTVGEIEPPDAHPDSAAEQQKGSIVKGLVAATIVIMFTLMITSFRAGHALTSFSSPQPIVIKITGHQWWWEAEYTDDAKPSNNITTANEIHIPVGQPVKLVMKSNDVIHSFWVPNLNGKKDLVPGFVTTMWLNAEKPGTYLGQCAEFCGAQHAHMRFAVIADAPEDFKNWVSAQQQSSVQPTNDLQKRGQEIFVTSSCVTCHTVQGTIAGGRVGPNLTHIGSRQRIAAETIPNTRGHLGGWITDPQSIKPGVIMPMNTYSPEDLKALIEYIQSLK